MSLVSMWPFRNKIKYKSIEELPDSEFCVMNILKELQIYDQREFYIFAEGSGSIRFDPFVVNTLLRNLTCFKYKF